MTSEEERDAIGLIELIESLGALLGSHCGVISMVKVLLCSTTQQEGRDGEGGGVPQLTTRRII